MQDLEVGGDTEVMVFGGEEPAHVRVLKSLIESTTPGERVRKDADGNPIPAGLGMPDESMIPWGSAQALEPPIDPSALLHLFNLSDTLRQCVDAMVTNIDGYGWMFEPVIDFDADDAEDQVATAIHAHRLALALANGGSSNDVEAPTREEVLNVLPTYRARSKREKARAEAFFKGCCYEMTFMQLRKRSRMEREIVGWAGWEVIRNGTHPARLAHLPSKTLRVTTLERDPVTILTRVPTSAVTSMEVKVQKRFRRIVQVDDAGRTIWFKEYGDPRVMSSQTGRFYVEEQVGDVVLTPFESLARAEGADVRPATEVVWFAIFYPDTPYGMPRWHGQVPSVVGNRLTAEVNVEYLGDSAIPRAMLLANGCRITADSTTKLKAFFQANKGKAHNRLAIVEAAPARDMMAMEGGGTTKLELVPLRETQRDDATFQEYVEANSDKIGESFRLPPIIRGKSKDINKATSQVARELSDDQVFAPERDDFDGIINQTLMRDLGINFWRFKSRGSTKRDPEAMARVGETLIKSHVITPAEFRPQAELILGVDLPASAGDWQRLPPSMIVSGFTPPQAKDGTYSQDAGAPGEAPPVVTPTTTNPNPEVPARPAVESVEQMAKQLMVLRKTIAEAKARDAMATAMRLADETESSTATDPPEG
jgi:PBSX family phage portal protein